MGIQLKNNVSSTLAAAISLSDVGITVATGTGARFPTLSATDYFYATLETSQGTQEIIKVTARSGDNMTIVRAQDGSTANSFGIGARIAMQINVATITTYDPAGTGAVATTVQTKLRESVSVLDFGADPTGATDSYVAFQAAHDSFSAANSSVGGEILIPKGNYYLSQTWKISKQVTITGINAGDHIEFSASSLRFPANTNGIRIYSAIDTPTGNNGAGGTIIDRLFLYAPNAVNTSGDGIFSTTLTIVKNCNIQYFGGNGIYLYGQTGVGETGICDESTLSDIRILNCRGHGVRIRGNDANVIKLIGVQAINSTGYGFYDVGVYCNTYIGCQAAGNAGGSYYSDNNNLYLGCYTEDAASPTSSLSASLVFGGTMQAYESNKIEVATTTGGMAFNIGSGPVRYIWKKNNAEIGRIETTDSIDNFKGANFNSGGNDYVSVTTPAAGTRITYSVNATAQTNAIVFLNSNGNVGSIQTSGSATSYNTSSDYRLKNITGNLVNSGAFIDALKPRIGLWKTDGKPFVGFVAHEVQEISPSTVSGKKDATEDVGDVFDNKNILIYKNVEKPNTLPEEWTWVYTATVPKIQHMEYGSAEFIANIVAELQSLRKRVTALETKT
jgi:hypothetical protein